MSSHLSHVVDRNEQLPVVHAPSGPVDARAHRVLEAEARQRRGRILIFSGFAITIAGVVLYCAACFAGGLDADMGDLLFKNTVPFARATLGVLGVGTLVWLAGSLTYLRGAMDADDDPEPRGGRSD
ncbi:MAG: hypothetical protein IT384_08835 [Deltaproteobacteria bacterium]|nr:hypothetical protein [Deltaproteobacteria bacterium]